MSKFSQELQQRLITYFAKKEIQITSEQADEYLDSLAGLCIAMTDGGNSAPAGPAR